MQTKEQRRIWVALCQTKSKPAYEALMKCYPLNPEPLTGEIFKDIEGYNGDYQISNYGRVKSLKRGRQMILKPSLRSGYLLVKIYQNTKVKNFPVHRLVAQAFVPNPDNKPEVNHIDGRKFNNFAENLEWATSQENVVHAFEKGLNKNPSGSKSNVAKFTDEQISWIREHYKFRDKEFGCNALAEKFNVSASTISFVINNKTYRNID